MPLAIRFWELLMQQGILTNSSRASRFPHWAQSSCETLLVMWSNEFFNSSSRNLPMCPGTSWCFVFFYGTSWHPEEQLKNEIAWVNVAACLVLVLISPWIEWFPQKGTCVSTVCSMLLFFSFLAPFVLHSGSLIPMKSALLVVLNDVSEFWVPWAILSSRLSLEYSCRWGTQRLISVLRDTVSWGSQQDQVWECCSTSASVSHRCSQWVWRISQSRAKKTIMISRQKHRR